MDTPSDSTDSRTAATGEVIPTAKYRIWAAHCPFRKTGSPVLGTMGASVKPVVVMHMETWNRLCKDVPQLQTTLFEVGTFD